MKDEDYLLIVNAWNVHKHDCEKCRLAIELKDLCPIGLKMVHQWQWAHR